MSFEDDLIKRGGTAPDPGWRGRMGSHFDKPDAFDRSAGGPQRTPLASPDRIAMNDNIDDEVMGRFDGLIENMRAKRLSGELPAEEMLPEAAPDDAGDEEALLAMFEGGGMEPAPEQVDQRPVDDFAGPTAEEMEGMADKKKKGGGGGMGGMMGGGGLGGMMGGA